MGSTAVLAALVFLVYEAQGGVVRAQSDLKTFSDTLGSSAPTRRETAAMWKDKGLDPEVRGRCLSRPSRVGPMKWVAGSGDCSGRRFRAGSPGLTVCDPGSGRSNHPGMAPRPDP